MAPTIVYVTGFRQHAGKTVTSLGLISQLRKRMDPARIAYLKPVGQELVTLPEGGRLLNSVEIGQSTVYFQSWRLRVGRATIYLLDTNLPENDPHFQGLTGHVWTVLEYVRYPVHVSDFERAIWQEERNEVLTSALDRYRRRKPLPTS